MTYLSHDLSAGSAGRDELFLQVTGETKIQLRAVATRLLAGGFQIHKLSPHPLANQVTFHQTVPDSQHHCVLEAGKVTWWLAALRKSKPQW